MLLDTAVIDELRETLGDDVWRSFADRMLAEVADTARTLDTLLSQGDLDTLARTAHRTSGSAAGTGAKGLHALLKEIENTARSGDAARLPALLATIPLRAEETRAAMSAHSGR